MVSHYVTFAQDGDLLKSQLWTKGGFLVAEFERNRMTSNKDYKVIKGTISEISYDDSVDPEDLTEDLRIIVDYLTGQMPDTYLE